MKKAKVMKLKDSNGTTYYMAIFTSTNIDEAGFGVTKNEALQNLRAKIKIKK